MPLTRTCIFLLLISYSALGQITEQQSQQLSKLEADLIPIADSIVDGSDHRVRLKACVTFIPKLVQALKTPNSYDYPFDSLRTVSILYPDDRTFRVFTWQVTFDWGGYRYYGAIQMNSDTLSLFPLFDNSDSIVNPLDTIAGANSWFGALYYRIVQTKKKKNQYYTLFGWDGNDLWSMKKIIDVLHFSDEGKPLFGAPIFNYETEEEEYTQNRVIIEYKKNATVTLNYAAERKMIIFDHVAPQDEKTTDLRFTYVPDGTYEGFRLKKGKWVYVKKVFDFSIDEFDSPPGPNTKN